MNLDYKTLEDIANGEPFLVRKRLKDYLATVTPEDPSEATTEPQKGTRTNQQSRAMWKQHQLVADELTKLGVTMRKVFEATTDFDIPPTKDNVHDLWLYFQRIMYPSMPSTRDLPKHGDHYQKIHDVMMKNLGEKFHADYIDFPVDKNKGNDKIKGITKAEEMAYPEDIGQPTF